MYTLSTPPSPPQNSSVKIQRQIPLYPHAPSAPSPRLPPFVSLFFFEYGVGQKKKGLSSLFNFHLDFLKIDPTF